MSVILKVKRMGKTARLPYRASRGAAAYDLCACTDTPISVPVGEFRNIPTGIAIELPDENHVALIFSRSGHGAKLGLSLVNSVGVIDSDYRGEISVGIINHGSETFTVSDGDRIAQMMLTTCIPLDIVESDSLSDTERGAGGFGSTGAK
ncbi:MAG: dUTP diphosphatase [Oscillospiraceae bacterium]